MPLKEYTTTEDIENYLLIEIDPAFEPQVKRWIESMENHIDKETGRNFKADTVASVKKYDGDGEKDLFIDDCVAISKVEVGGQEVDCLSYPANSLPKTKIEREDGTFSRGSQNVEITARWGYSEKVPADIEFACTVLVAGIINRTLSHEGEVQSKSVGPYSVTFKTEKGWQDFDSVKETLKKYKRFII